MTFSEWIPVNPQLNENNEFVSLKNFNSTPIKPNSLAEADAAKDLRTKEYKYSLSTASKFEVMAIGGIDHKFGTTTFVHDSIIYKTSRGSVSGGSTLVKGTMWGYGMRLTVKVSNVQFGVNVNWGIVAAALQLGYLDAEFEIEILGLSQPDLFSSLPSPTDLNMSTLSDILKLGDEIRAKYMAVDQSQVVYKPLRIQVEPSMLTAVDPIMDDRTLIFVYQKIAERTEVQKAVKEGINKKLDPDLIKKYFKDYFGLTKNDDRADRSQRQDAEEWLGKS